MVVDIHLQGNAALADASQIMIFRSEIGQAMQEWM